MKIDVLVDLQYGDCGKGKVSKWLLEQNKYWGVAKFNGGPNAGHAVWIGDKKHTSHMLTSGIYDPHCAIVIGPGCVIDVDKFLEEVKVFEPFKVSRRTYIHPNAHVITKTHIEVDSLDTVIGTTKQGVGPAYADKMLRKGIRAIEVQALVPFTYDPETFPTEGCMLMEGSQGWWLDIDNGNYPYVTSSNIHPAHAFSTFGYPLQYLNDVYGVAKVYETYVGNKEGVVKALKEDSERIREVGQEYGETTGRPRSVGYLDLPKLVQAVNATGTTNLILNKLDVLEELSLFKLFTFPNSQLREYSNSHEFTSYIEETLKRKCPLLKTITFSANKETV